MSKQSVNSNKLNKKPARLLCAMIIAQVIESGKTLDQAFEQVLPTTIASNDQSFIKACAYGTCRWYFQLTYFANQLLNKPLRRKDQLVYFLLLIGLYQLQHSDTPTHAVVAETVQASKALRQPWAQGLINACLRKFMQQAQKFQQQLLININNSDNSDNIEAYYAHPNWFIEKVQSHWIEQDQWKQILLANNTQAPMSIRDHSDKTNAPVFKQLAQAVAVEAIPGFTTGDISVQDQASQWAAPLLDAQANMRVLDACAAPGGKTGHLLELTPSLQLTALDISAKRLEKVKQNLQRLKQLSNNVKLTACDASQTDTWWSGEQFDRILLDAPCSGTGVIRRHPEIKLLRLAQDINGFQQQQRRLLSALWPLLKPGGKLLYTTCSILPEENSQLIQQFLTEYNNIVLEQIDLPIGQATDIGWQCLPQINGHDGFYYCLLSKHP